MFRLVFSLGGKSWLFCLNGVSRRLTAYVYKTSAGVLARYA
jgi:hypothetical protein